MNRNTEAHFSQLPTLEISRSKFNMGHTHKTTANTSELTPIFVDPDIVPGDTVTMRMADIIRMMTPIAPVMDSAFADFYFFFVPNRLVYNNWKMLMGENETAPWTQTVEKVVPQSKIANNLQGGGKLARTVLKGSVLNHMGIPLQEGWEYASGAQGAKEIKITSLPTKAYCLVWNEFFRDENLQNPVNVTKNDGDAFIVNKNHSNYTSDPASATINYEQWGGLPCLKVCKPFDYFTGALPGAQKGPQVTLPFSDAKIPVSYANYNDWSDPTNPFWVETQDYLAIKNTAEGANRSWKLGTFKDSANDTEWTPEDPDSDYQDTIASYAQLYTDLSSATGATITQLRQAFAIQKFYERDARGGTRYIESIWSHFRVRNPDYRLQRPEYLGGFRQNINMNMVVQSGATEEGLTPLGTTGAYSVSTNEQHDLFSHSFTEHGILLGLMAIRTEHTYCQGIRRSWFKKKRLDWYSPEFANLSEQAILNQEIYAQGTSKDQEAFGYQEAWSEMRHMPSLLTGEMDLTLSDTLGGVWTYGDVYDELPKLGDKWIQETPSNLQRTLAIQDHDQFMCDFYFEPIYTRPLPLYSVPGLVDHH